MKGLIVSMMFALPLLASPAFASKNEGKKDTAAVTCEKCAKKDEKGNCAHSKEGKCDCKENCDCKSCGEDKK